MSEERSFEQLVEGVRAGDDHAAAEIVRRYEPSIRRAIRYRLSDTRLNAAFDSMDICQSVMASFFIRAANGQYELDTPEGIVQLLMGMAKKKLAMQVRKQRAKRRDHRRTAPDAIDDHPLAANDPTPSRQVAARELLGEVRARLSDDERQIVEWRQAGIEWTEIAKRLNTTPEAVRKKFSRGIDRIAADLGIDEEDEPE
jgi:RNA polymerase sigma factor (sigma-70 family)